MVLHISADRTIGELQSDFSESFPGLKLVFFSKPHRAYKGSAAKFLLEKKELPLHQISSNIKTGYLLLEPDMVVWQVERLFEEEYALHVQVFRKSGNTWLETSVTDDLTLEQQQAKAVASEHVQQEFVDPLDYRDQD
jgi:hypothetical protein